MPLLPPRPALALLALLLTGCGAAGYEEAARETARMIGAGDLVLIDTVSNFAADTGRTARFAIEGDPIALVTLHFSTPERCAPNPDCAAQLRDSIAYARDQAAFAAGLMRAFAPCNVRGITELDLVQSVPPHVTANVSLALPIEGSEGPRSLDRARACAEAAARADRGPWGAREAGLSLYLGDVGSAREPEPPLILGWKTAALAAGRDGPAVIEGVTLEGTRARVSEWPVLDLPFERQEEVMARVVPAVNAWLAGQNLAALGLVGPVMPTRFLGRHVLLNDDPNRLRLLVTAPTRPGLEQRAVAVTHDLRTRQSTAFQIVEPFQPGGGGPIRPEAYAEP